MRKIQIRDSFWLMLAVAVFLDEECLLPVFLFAAAVHEAGHWLAVRLCGGTVYTLQLSAGGGLLRYHLPRSSPMRDVVIALSGPGAGLLLTLTASLLQLPLLAGASLLLSIFNLLPVVPLDGGRALEALCPLPALTRATAVFFSALVLFTGLWVGAVHQGWGLACIGLMLVLCQQTGLQSPGKRGRINHTEF